jgi:radical SAM superfamily enzyme YgiQ (UPF0313 family)
MTSNVFLADLTHTALGISALSFPLGTAYVASFAKMEHGDDFEFQLFKFPEDLARNIVEHRPSVLAFSNYAWNFEIGYKIAAWAKELLPNITIIFGGPNFPTDDLEKEIFLRQRPVIDFYIENEGEIGFSKLLGALKEFNHNVEVLKSSDLTIANCCYISQKGLITGTIERILNVNQIPSPYLSGMLDKFFDDPLIPMVETTRGCPFSCSFCADGLSSKNRVVRFDHDTTKRELFYIADKVRNVDEIIITDLNFGMYKQDIVTAEFIAELQDKYGWPLIVKATAGKNQPQRVINTAAILKGSWLIGSAIQSTDEEVLKNIKRGNISSEAYRMFVDYVNSQSENAQPYTEIILALPGDTKEKHFKSLRAGIENKVSTFRMYQAMLLHGTDMASVRTREAFGLITKFRILPGCIGRYQLGDDVISVTEIEEIVVGGKDMPFEDYVSCRVMNLLVETFVNNGLFEELFESLENTGIGIFEILEHIHENTQLFSDNMREIVDDFISETVDYLYDSRSEAEMAALEPETLERYLSGDLGKNELLEHRALLYFDMEDTADVLLRNTQQVLHQRGLLTDNTREYFAQLVRYTICQKSEISRTDAPIKASFNYDFKTLSRQRFQADPKEAIFSDDPIELSFFHTPEQIKHINNAVELYKHHPGGAARMIQRSNLKMMYRQVSA